MQDFNQAIAANPNDAAAYLGRGNLLRSQNDFNGALADLNQAIRLNPEGAQAYHARGLIYQRQGNDVQAITDFNNAIDRDPFAGAPYQARGQSLMATGKYEAAVEDFNAALERQRQQLRGLGGPRTSVTRSSNNRPKAVESYQRAVQVNPNNGARQALRSQRTGLNCSGLRRRAMRALHLHLPASVFRNSSSQWMSYWPFCTSAFRTSVRKRGNVVSMPSMMNSSSARRRRISASVRVRPWTISLPTRES